MRKIQINQHGLHLNLGVTVLTSQQGVLECIRMCPSPPLGPHNTLTQDWHLPMRLVST